MPSGIGTGSPPAACQVRALTLNGKGLLLTLNDGLAARMAQTGSHFARRVANFGTGHRSADRNPTTANNSTISTITTISSSN
jgi:hypothetical protein